MRLEHFPICVPQFGQLFKLTVLNVFVLHYCYQAKNNCRELLQKNLYAILCFAYIFEKLSQGF